MSKGFWSKSRVLVMGGGSWGTTLAELAAQQCANVDIWVRREEQAAMINSTRVNSDYLPDLKLSENIRASHDLDKVFAAGPDAVIWALPAEVCRSEARRMANYFSGREIILHATKGVEEGSLKRVSEILLEEIPCPRIGVISGPNLAKEVASGQPAATVVASRFEEVIEVGQAILHSDRFRVYGEFDIVGVEWAGVLKNILAIAAGTLDYLGMGWNTRSMLMTRGLAEMVRIGLSLGAKKSTFLGLAGVGDMLATCGSPLSRNYRVGVGLAEGKPLDAILKELGSVAEGVRTTRIVAEFCREKGVDIPITEGVRHLIEQSATPQEVLAQLMARPVST